MAKEERKRAEQRRQSRLPALAPVFVTDIGVSDAPSQVLGLLVDLSENGARLKLPISLELGTSMRVEIPWFEGSVNAKVIRCSRESGQLNPPCDIGIQFETAIKISRRLRRSMKNLKESVEDYASAA